MKQSQASLSHGLCPTLGAELSLSPLTSTSAGMKPREGPPETHCIPCEQGEEVVAKRPLEAM